VIISNNLAMAGHVEVGSNVTIGGVCAFHQFTRIGDYAMVGATSYITQDVVPFALTGTDPVRVVDINKIKLERTGFSEERRQNIRRAFRILFRENLTTKDAVAKLGESFPGDADVKLLADFVSKSLRGILRMQIGSRDE
jgi:UDP-N-acetylglucosamine acyltransferase